MNLSCPGICPGPNALPVAGLACLPQAEVSSPCPVIVWPAEAVCRSFLVILFAPRNRIIAYQRKTAHTFQSTDTEMRYLIKDLFSCQSPVKRSFNNPFISTWTERGHLVGYFSKKIKKNFDGRENDRERN